MSLAYIGLSHQENGKHKIYSLVYCISSSLFITVRRHKLDHLVINSATIVASKEGLTLASYSCHSSYPQQLMAKWLKNPNTVRACYPELGLKASKWYGYTKTRQARQNRPRRSKTKKWLVLSGFLDQTFTGNFKEVDQLMPDSTRISLCV